MNRIRLYLLLLATVGTILADDEIHISGIVTDIYNQPVSGAFVRYGETNCTGTTGQDGSFTLQGIPVNVHKTRIQNRLSGIRVINNRLNLSLSSSARVEIVLFDISGRYHGTLVNRELHAGLNSIAISPNFAKKTFILRCTIGKEITVYKMIAGAWHFSTFTSAHNVTTSSFGTIAEADNQNDSVINMIKINHGSYAPQKVIVNPPVDTSLTITLLSAEADWIFALDKQCADQHASVKTLKNGNYMVLGSTHGTGGDYDMGIVTLDTSGFVLTKRLHGNSGNELAYELGTNAQGDIRVFGTYSSDQLKSAFLAMGLSQNGDSITTRTFTYTYDLRMAGGTVTPDGGYVISGYFYGLDSVLKRNISDAIVARFSSSDEIVWQKAYSQDYYTVGDDIITLQQGGYMLSGSYYDTLERDNKMFLYRLNENGTILNQFTFMKLQQAFFLQIMETYDNKLLCLGRTNCGAKVCPYIARVSQDCTVEWDSVITDPTIQITCMAKLPDSTIVLGCRGIPVTGSETDFVFERIKLINIDKNGRLLRERFISEECGYPQSIAVDRDGAMIITSCTGNTFDKMNFYVLKVRW